MSFCTSAIAGPSRLPATAGRVMAAQSVVRAPSRRYATARSTTADEKRERAYGRWLNEVGWQFKTPKRGEKAKWLGGEVPYQSNPSFKPPPPLSNDLQNLVYKELRAGKKTIGEISQAYSISKNRILAIAKLKTVEEEFRRQNLPLQTAFQDGMETLLGVVSPLDKHTKAASIELRRREEASRVGHTATSAELEEEAQYDDDKVDNLMLTGAFAKAKNNIGRGVDRTVWDFRTDAEATADRKAAAAEAEDRAARKAELEKNPKAKPPAPPSTTAPIGKTVYRFVDTSAKSSK